MPSAVADKPKTSGKPKNRRGRPATGKTATANLFARVDPQLGPALDAFVQHYNETHPRTDKGAHIEIALKEYLAKAGYWPPKPDA